MTNLPEGWHHSRAWHTDLVRGINLFSPYSLAFQGEMFLLWIWAVQGQVPGEKGTFEGSIIILQMDRIKVTCTHMYRNGKEPLPPECWDEKHMLKHMGGRGRRMSVSLRPV